MPEIIPWQVVARTEALAVVVFRGEEAICKQVAAGLVGKPLGMPAESGAMTQVGEALGAWAEAR